MSAFTLQEIIETTGGELLQFVPTEEVKDPSMFYVDGVSTDTRTIEEGNLFLALVGDKFDGNTFAVAAATDGASALLLSSMEHAPKNVPVVLVPDTKIAYEKLATHYRKRMGCQVIAVTGSVGKTSTREMIASALSRGSRVFATKANKNNEIGLCETILKAPEDTQILVLEMGMRGRGQISELTNIALPNVAVITKIGVAHIELLGSQDEILHAKLEVLEGLQENGLLILPYQDEYLKKAVKEGMIRSDVKIAYTSPEPVVFDKPSYGQACAGEISVEDCRICFAARGGFATQTDVNLKLSVVGLHHVGNAMAGLLCGLYYGIDKTKIEEGIASFTQIEHREQLVKAEDVMFMDDSYNAGPESMISALESIRRISGSGRAFACISDMLELGHVASEKHFEIGKRAAELKLDGLLVMGNFQKDVLAGVRSVDAQMPVALFPDKASMTQVLTEIVKPGDYVLLKASHSFEMYTILDDYHAKVGKEELT